MAERALKPCPLCAGIPTSDRAETSCHASCRTWSMTSMDWSVPRSREPGRPPAQRKSKRHYLAAGCTRDGIRLIEVLYFKLNEAVGPTPRTLV